MQEISPSTEVRRPGIVIISDHGCVGEGLVLITFECSCGREFKAREEYAGKRAKCPDCGSIVAIPQPPPPAFDEDLGDDLPYDLADPVEPPGPNAIGSTWAANPDRSGSQPPSMSFKPLGHQTGPDSGSSGSPSSGRPGSTWHAAPPDQVGGAQTKLKRRDGSSRWRPSEAERSGRDLIYWVFIFALIPLAASILGGDGPNAKERLDKTLQALPRAQADHIVQLLNDDKSELSDVLANLPDQKIDADAHLPATTHVHWAYAGLSALFFLVLVGAMFTSGSAPPFSLVKVALFTSTIGILFLTIVQLLAQFSGRVGIIRGRGLFMVLLLIIFLIGFSYQAALDPANGFWLSMLGFTLGVGLCEEACKALPLLWHFRSNATLGWRGACLWGLASGIGFGVAEGVLYSADHYNGVATLNTYLVRFLSCVSLHAMWSGAVGISLERNQENVQMDWEDDFFSSCMGLLRVLAVPVILHGLYDTLLKKDMEIYALGVAVVTFGWFSGTIEAAKRQDENQVFGLS